MRCPAATARPLSRVLTVTVLDASDDLLEEVPCFCLGQPPLLDNVVKELASRDVLEHHENVRRRVDDLIETDNMRMREAFEVRDLAPDLFGHVEAADCGSLRVTGYLAQALQVRALTA